MNKDRYNQQYGNGQNGIGNGQNGIGNGQNGIGNGQNGIGNGQYGTGNGQNGMDNRRIGSTQLQGTLAEQISALKFVKVELELYLDTHPNCQTALEYYQKTLAELDRLIERYENEHGPLTCAGVRSTDEWTWINGPWPWQNEKMKGRE